MKRIVAVFALMSMFAVSQASAAIVMSGHRPQDAVISGGMATWTLTFEATEPGGVVAGFIGNFAGNNGFVPQAGSSMSQQLVGGAVPTPTKDLNAAIEESLDSQFLVTSAEIISAVAPFETTATLGGGFTLTAAARAQSKALIQIVAPEIALNKIDFSFGVSEAVGDTSNTTSFAGTLQLIPEPATFAMAGMGLIGLVGVARRRKA